MVVSLRYPPVRVLAALLCFAVMALTGFTAINEASLNITSSAQSSAQVDEYLLASATDKVTYWGGWGLAVAGTIILGAVAVALAPAAVVVTIGAIAITAKAATAAGTVALIGGMSLQAYGGRPQ